MNDEKKNNDEIKSDAKTTNEAANAGEYNRDLIRDENIVFYYSRERRLNRASPAVQEAMKDTAPKRRGFFRGMMGTRSSFFIFIPIILIMFLITTINKNSSTESGPDFWNNNLTLKALKYQGTTFLSIKKSVKNADKAYTGEVDLVISPVENVSPKRKASQNVKASQDVKASQNVKASQDVKDEKGIDDKTEQRSSLVVSKRVFFSPETDEDFRFSVPFEAEKLLILLQCNLGIKRYTVTVE